MNFEPPDPGSRKLPSMSSAKAVEPLGRAQWRESLTKAEDAPASHKYPSLLLPVELQQLLSRTTVVPVKSVEDRSLAGNADYGRKEDTATPFN
jgi:hypothetical protein